MYNMINKIFDPTQPIILGLAGKAATGKTSVAEAIVPKAQVNVADSDLVWDHIFFALPLYEMATVKRNTRGLRERDRQLYLLHSVVYDLFGGSPIANVPEYDTLIDVVRAIYGERIPEEGKPRSFLQKAGDICRDVSPDCFTDNSIRFAKRLHSSYMRSQSFDTDPLPFSVIISDVRFINEAQKILQQPNGIVVCYEASDEVRNSRLMERDGHGMTEAQKSHKSELEINDIIKFATAIINTDNLTVEQQKNETIRIVNSLIGINA